MLYVWHASINKTCNRARQWVSNTLWAKRFWRICCKSHEIACCVCVLFIWGSKVREAFVWQNRRHRKQRTIYVVLFSVKLCFFRFTLLTKLHKSQFCRLRAWIKPKLHLHHRPSHASVDVLVNKWCFMLPVKKRETNVLCRGISHSKCQMFIFSRFNL